MKCDPIDMNQSDTKFENCQWVDSANHQRIINKSSKGRGHVPTKQIVIGYLSILFIRLRSEGECLSLNSFILFCLKMLFYTYLLYFSLSTKYCLLV